MQKTVVGRVFSNKSRLDNSDWQTTDNENIEFAKNVVFTNREKESVYVCVQVHVNKHKR